MLEFYFLNALLLVFEQPVLDGSELQGTPHLLLPASHAMHLVAE